MYNREYEEQLKEIDYTVMNISIPNSILPHLNEISARLWSGHAAVMVGAGFSCNAIPINESSKAFPDWNKLGELFYEKTRGESIKDGRFLNVLKLADELQASFGRPMLHQLLRDSIPDSEYEPSKLHVDLLNLPWSDILTTNYDTLLERTARTVTEHNYQLIVGSQDLIYSEKPRIIKLHGSFPSDEPFVITEEDYRRYPIDFAPFVNTVQQSLLENTLCLIGFSGDDPNFLRWIGWIRDNLGDEKSPKIYLIGVLNLTKAQVSLLEKYNIVPIDMSDLDGVGKDDHYKGIQKFFEFCSSKKSDSDWLDWPKGGSKKYPDKSGNVPIAQQIEEVIIEWKAQRENYPGWVVVPEDRRQYLWEYTKQWEGAIKSFEDLSVKVLLEFLYEYFWRIEKCLCPIFDPNVSLIEYVLKCGDEFLKDNVNGSDSSVNNSAFADLDLHQVKSKCCFIQLSYLRYLREEGKIDKWKSNEKRVSAFLGQSSDSSRYHYEKCLLSLFELDINELETQLESWIIKPNLPYWSAKKAGLLAEMGRLDEAINLLEDALKVVRSKLNLKPVVSDYSAVSQESYILVLLRYIQSGLSWVNGDYSLKSEFSDRWNVLKQYKCDPWNELRLLESPLRNHYSRELPNQNKPLFDLNRTNKTINFGGSNYEVLEAFRLLKFAEDVGLPFRIPGSTYAKEAAMGAIERLSEVVPYWSMSIMFRIGDNKAVDRIFDRRSLLSMRQSEVDSLIRNYLRVFENIVLSGDDKNNGPKTMLVNVVPELLSRLISKSSKVEKEAIFNLLGRMYSFGKKIEYSQVDKLVSRSVRSLSEIDIVDYLPMLIELSIGSDEHYDGVHKFSNPFEFTDNLNEKFIKVPSCFSLDSDRINELIQIVIDGNESERLRCIRTLAELKRFEVLSENQVSDFLEAIWSSVDSQGFPKFVGYYKFAICRDLSPGTVDGDKLIKQYILNEEIEAQKHNPNKGVVMSRGAIPLCHEISGASEFVEWSIEETHVIFTKLLNWWDLDKDYLKKYESGEVRDEFELRFKRLRGALVRAVSKKFCSDREKDVSALMNMVQEMTDYGLTVCSIKCAFSHIIPSWKKCLITEVSNSYLETNEVFIEDAVEGMYSIFDRCDDETIKEHCLSLLASSLVSRDKHRLLISLSAARRIIFGYKECFKKSFENAVLFSLDKLRTETDGHCDFLTLNSDLFTREISAHLAFELYTHYRESKSTLPCVIEQWRAICEDPDEFVEIRNAWLHI
ncbi:SIR2 family protein [Shewanella sp. Isolate8]|uniref:SIR2 family NAD-dependent protein deacylase n=1 Tax=Shewanella sp. Isolate8 TaxID=2908529 RepID=UPI001EFCB74C|nr:SIR2 family protein [Shewanella sp. Isolate8]MCG9745982.1 SIR2 family protein [Shewanella sp. Isolate8]